MSAWHLEGPERLRKGEEGSLGRGKAEAHGCGSHSATTRVGTRGGKGVPRECRERCRSGADGLVAHQPRASGGPVGVGHGRRLAGTDATVAGRGMADGRPGGLLMEEDEDGTPWWLTCKPKTLKRFMERARQADRAAQAASSADGAAAQADASQADDAAADDSSAVADDAVADAEADDAVDDAVADDAVADTSPAADGNVDGDWDASSQADDAKTISDDDDDDAAADDNVDADGDAVAVAEDSTVADDNADAVGNAVLDAPTGLPS